MLYKEIEDCEQCPLKKEDICKGGWSSSPSGTPIEPPCCGFDDDTDLDRWVNDYYCTTYAEEAKQDREIERRKKAKDRAEKAAKTRHECKAHCYREWYEQKRAKKALEAYKAKAQFAQSFAEAVNFANKCFRYKERICVKPELQAELRSLETAYEKAQEAYKAKKKEFYASRRTNRG